MKLTEWAVRKPVTLTMVIGGVCALGIVALLLMRVDMLPEIEPPAISVVSLYPGAGAIDIESELTKRLEDKFSSINNLDTLSSVSKDNISLITLKFDWGANLDEAANDIRDQIGLVRRELPDDVEEPIIFKFNSSDFPIMIVTVTAEASYRDLYRIVDKQIVDPLRRVLGVGEVMQRGGLVRQISVYIERAQLEKFNLSMEQIERALADENVTMPAGELKRGFSEIKLRVPGKFTSVEDVRSVAVGTFKGSVITLGSIARVEDDFQETTEQIWSNGRKAIVLIIRKQSGKNTVDVCNRLRAELASYQRRMPADVAINVLIDTGEPIVNSLNNLRRSMLLGGILVVLVTWVFLLRLRSSIIIALTIPISFISVFTLMFALGYTVNMISLLSLTIAVGMVVDAAIVVLEAISRHLARAHDPFAAAVSGTHEVGMAIFGSTLTTIVVFLPLLFTTGITGIIFKQLAVIVTATLAVSWFVSITLTPMLASKWLVYEETHIAGWWKRVMDPINAAYSSVEQAYGRLLGRAMRHPLATILIAVAFFGSSLAIVPLIGSEFMPSADTGDIDMTIEYDESTRLEETMRAADALNGFFATNITEALGTYLVAGQSREAFASAAGEREGPNTLRGGAKLVSVDRRSRSNKEVAQSLRAFCERLPGIKRFSITTVDFIQRIFLSASGGKPISIEIQGTEFATLNLAADMIKAAITNVNGLVDISIIRPEERRELWVNVDRTRAAALGVTMNSVARNVRSMFYGNKATEFRDAGDDFDVFVRLPSSERTSADDVANVTVPSTIPGAPVVKLSNVASIEESSGPLEIHRKNRARIVRIEGDVFKRSSGDIVNDIRSRILSLDLPIGVTVAYGGEAEEQGKAFSTLFWLLILGIVLVFMVMAGQFESYKDPFVIMFSVPFAFTGSIWFLLLTGNCLNIMSFIGIILLVGVVVNNAIVLIDYTIQLRHEGKELREAIALAGVVRLKPVLMTTITAVCGALPMTFSHAEGAEQWRPMGATIVGGLTVSTLVTLVLVPVLYMLFERRSVKARH